MLQYHKYLIFNLNQNHQLIFWKTLRISGIPEKLEKCQERKKAVRGEVGTELHLDGSSMNAPQWLQIAETRECVSRQNSMKVAVHEARAICNISIS